MHRFVNRPITLFFPVFLAVIFSLSAGNQVFAADPKMDAEELQAKLDEAKKLLAQDKASHDETAEKKRMIDEKLTAQKEREAKIFEELKELCEEQDKLKPGSLNECMAKLN